MATLVLTVVGGAVAGPIGATVGAVVGQQIDQRLFAPKGREGPRLTGLAVQTSSYGTQIPKIFGTMRVAGCVIWATELIETRARGRGGKGQPSTTTYSYAASFAVALSARPIDGVGRIWADGKLLRGAGGDWKTATGFRLHTGDEGQAPDPLIASLETAAPAHRGLAYAVFENLQLADFGNRIPSLTFEVIGDAAAPGVGAIVRAIGDGTIMGAGPARTIHGYAASGGSVAGAVRVLGDIAGAWMVPEGGAMRMVDTLDSTTLTVADDAAVTETRRPIEAVARTLSVSHYDPARDYQIGVQQAQRPGGAGWREEQVELAAALSAGQGKTIARDTLLRQERGRVSRRVVLDAAAIGTAPGAAIVLPDSGATWRVTQASVEGMKVTLDVTPASQAGMTAVADPGRLLSVPDDPAGVTRVEVAELPALDDVLATTPQVMVFAAGSAPGWRRAAVLYSTDDGVTWEPGGGTAAPAVIGALAGALGAAPRTLTDRRHGIEVDLAHDAMTLESADAPAIDRGANLALVGDELVQFGEAVQIAPRRWRLATLHRGRRGTDAATHPAGTRFVLIDRDAILSLAAPTWRPGDTLRVLASGIGDAAGPAAAATVLNGSSLAPPAPVRLRASEQADGGVRIDWVRRSRLGWRWDDGVDAPLAEEREAYRVTIDDGGGVRDLIVTVPQIAIPAAGRAAGAVTISVRQLGTHAASPAATITIAGAFA